MDNIEINSLIRIFNYIEGVRHYMRNNKLIRILIKDEKLADLYFAGKYLIEFIEKYGNNNHKKELENIINEYNKGN